MQNSLFRRRLAVRACFDVLLGGEVISATDTTDDDLTTSLLARRRSLVDLLRFALSWIADLISGAEPPFPCRSSHVFSPHLIFLKATNENCST